MNKKNAQKVLELTEKGMLVQISGACLDGFATVTQEDDVVYIESFVNSKQPLTKFKTWQISVFNVVDVDWE